MGDYNYKLSCSLDGHEDDVRGVAFPNPKLVLSASRDATVRAWALVSTPPPTYDGTISSHGSAFVNAVAYVRPTPEYPEGLIVSGGKETIIEVRRPGKPPEDNAEALLLGHSRDVCALDVDLNNQYVVSGAWDGQGRAWKVGKWESAAILEGHEGSVWAVLALDQNTIVTGCADTFIRVFDLAGKLQNKFQAHAQPVRALCRVPQNHLSGADFASASNDGLIKLWSRDGRKLMELHGHESFIYSLASSPHGELVSSGEDRTVRIWRGSECVQTITHPAISVWAVAVCAENGDIVSGASDRKVRIFSRRGQRHALAEDLLAFEESVKASSIPQEQVGDINKEKLPGPEFLVQKSGTKEGQVVMVREANGSVTAHQWSVGSGTWMSVGTVVQAVGSSGKKLDYLGKDYDYVFDVDIEDGKPPLKLPYNLSDNPYEAATKFIQDNELPMTYLDQVANFITTNTQGATISQSEAPPAPPGSDPWGTESRYRPGQTTSPPSTSGPPARPKVLPQTSYLAITTANLATIEKKIGELNANLVENGRKDISLNPSSMTTLAGLCSELTAGKPSDSTTVAALPLIIHLINAWPEKDRLPALDLLRLVIAASPSAATFVTPAGDDIIQVLKASSVFSSSSPPNNTMLALRSIANLFQTEAGRGVAGNNFDHIQELILSDSFLKSLIKERNPAISLTTVLINYSVLLTTSSLDLDSSSSPMRALALLEPLSVILADATDSEVLYRALVAIGTLLSFAREEKGGWEEVREAAKEVYAVAQKTEAVERKVKGEGRVRGVGAEIRALLK